MPERIFFENVHGKRVFCCLAEPDVAPAKRVIVIMSHGFQGSSSGPARSFVDFSRILVREGFSVLRFDQPHSGNSEGDFIDSSFREWVETIAYIGAQYAEQGYEVALLGQSMGATASMIATNHPALRDKVGYVILWVPDPETDTKVEPTEILEEGGQRVRGRFWREAQEMDFFGCLDRYSGGIHLVYGEHDRFVTEELRQATIRQVMLKGGEVVILKGQDHSPWDYDLAQEVYRTELTRLRERFF